MSSTDPRERLSPAPSRAGYLAIAVAAMMTQHLVPDLQPPVPMIWQTPAQPT